MDNNTLAIYIHELRNQFIHIQAAFELFNQSLTNRAGTGVLFAGQMVLMPASQVSALLWPPRARARTRGEALRKVLQLPEKHPLNDRRLSEMWERGDERVEEWITATKGKQVVFDFVGDPATVGDGSTTDECVFRAYNPDNNLFYYRGMAYNLKAVADAMMDVAGRVNAVYRQMFPEQAAAEDEAMRQAQAAAQAQQAALQGNVQAEALSADDLPPPVDLGEPAEPAPAKKPAAKKAAAKKPAAKKAPAKKAAPKKKAD
ncbi:hypothetical protein [Kordiimonas marina]|uniref:hypothetical protein n=1 Tax=Kordiimonas marina TaxID=2872312 RepID=UPI001FF219B4|nr:hypothetical protein [Kordiimonas marina]MCJ9428453.1 hypothetical protein [Kordiimonas marina]